MIYQGSISRQVCPIRERRKKNKKKKMLRVLKYCKWKEEDYGADTDQEGTVVQKIKGQGYNGDWKEWHYITEKKEMALWRR